MSNLLKFALGRNVTNRDPAPQPTLDAEGRLMIDIARNPEAAGLLWIVEVSSDLITWSSTPQDVEVISDLPERLIARDRTPASKEGARFLRFRVSINGSSSQ
jgi:hypothetical protein